ncbi:unnamed protein product [Plutella xylostella]|uniref:(diamondback moth) hypothetical protein n=1 Tax=Plutella xylostella TaxID=51655 RepID=A0A8S4F4L2_PLUXY|nr:unnamed protein product [Plutella xylostella]
MSSNEISHLKETIQVLISACGDKEESVNNEVIKSLTKVAGVYPNEVIEYFCTFYKNTAKINPVQLGNIIKVLEQTCVNHMKSIKSGLATELVEAMLQAMTSSADFQPAVQMGASAVLVAIAYVHLDLVLQSLMSRVPASAPPHYSIPHSLGSLAAVNTALIVPFVKDILAKLLPLLTLVRVDGTKQAFAFAFGHFAVAVSEQIGDNVENDNITSIKDNFVVEFSLIFDVLYNQWLHSSEARVTESVLEALGPITRLISERKFDETVNKLMLTLLALYRKPQLNSYYISQCISYLLTPSALNPKLTLLENVINSTNHTLFTMIVIEPDFDQPQSVKNHFEVLRCFDHMASQFPDTTIEGLLLQCKNNQLRDRMKAVIILTHLTTSSQVFIDKYAPKFIAILKVMTTMEQDLKMKKLIAKAIVGLVYRNCLVSAEDFSMVEFIIKHCNSEPSVVGTKADVAVSKTDVTDLYDTCKSSLILMCNSATKVRSQLRDLFLKALTIEEFSPSMATITSCLSSLLQNNASGDDTPDHVPEYKVSSDLIFIRCLTHLAEPDQVERNKNILLFLDEYSGDVHKNLKTSWKVEVERLLKFVMKDEPNDQWHSMLLEFLVTAIEQVNSNKWVENVATLLSHEILTIKQPPMIKGVSLQMLATLACHMSNAAVVEQVLKIIFLALKSIPMESVEYVSAAVGIASQQHGEYVMNDLDAFFKDIEAKRSSKLLNFISSRHSKNEAEINVSKYAVILCYGKIAQNCIDVHVLARLGENVTAILLDILKSNPPLDLCCASLTTLYEISKALYPASHHNVTIRNRWQLLNAVLEQIYNPNLDKQSVKPYPLVVKASKELTKLQKGILPEERNTIIRVLFTTIFTELSSLKKKYTADGNGDESDKLAKTLNDSLTLLHDLIREIILQSTCISTLDDIVSLLTEWLRNENDEIRTASMQIFQLTLDTYLKNVKLNYETPSKFGQMGYLLGLITPGIADTNFPVRLLAIDCIKLTIQIQYLYEGATIESNDECMTKLTAISNNILSNDLGMIADYSMDVCETICDKIPHQHMMQFIECLLEGYVDDEFISTGVSSVLEALFLKKGLDLFQSIERIVEVVLEGMDEVGPEARQRLLKPLTALARHHSNAVTAVLLAQKIPLRPSVVSCWRHLATDESLSVAILDNFLRTMTSIELFEDPYHITENHIAALQPLTLISALGEMLQQPSISKLCVSKFPELFTVLYTTLSCYMDADPPAYSVPSNKGLERIGFIPNREAIRLSPATIAMGTLNAFLERADCPKVAEACTLITKGASTAELATLVCSALVTSQSLVTSHSLVKCHGALVTCLCAQARCELAPRRAAAVALLGQMLYYRCNDNPVLAETVLSTLLSACKDSSAEVSALAARGLAHSPDHSLGVAVAALAAALDAESASQPRDNVPLAAMCALCALISNSAHIEAESARLLLVVAQKIRPFMRTAAVAMRENSVKLFGVIASKVSSESLCEQALNSVPGFLIHLWDDSAAVVRATKQTLKSIFSILKTPKTLTFVTTHLTPSTRASSALVCDLLRTLCGERPDAPVAGLNNAANYLRGPNAGPAVIVVGQLFHELYNLRDTHPEQATLDTEVTDNCRTRLIQLIKDPDPLVRLHSAQALSYLALFEAAR